MWQKFQLHFAYEHLVYQKCNSYVKVVSYFLRIWNEDKIFIDTILESYSNTYSHILSGTHIRKLDFIKQFHINYQVARETLLKYSPLSFDRLHFLHQVLQLGHSRAALDPSRARQVLLHLGRTLAKHFDGRAVFVKLVTDNLGPIP